MPTKGDVAYLPLHILKTSGYYNKKMGTADRKTMLPTTYTRQNEAFLKNLTCAKSS